MKSTSSANALASSAAIPSSIPFDDDLPGDPSGDSTAARFDAYTEAAPQDTRKLVKTARGLINDYGDKANHVTALCDMGIRSAEGSGDSEAEAAFDAIKSLYERDGKIFCELNGVVEALIDRLPWEKAGSNHSVRPPLSKSANSAESDPAVLLHLWQVAMDAICSTNVRDATEGVDQVIHTLLAMKRFMPAVEA